MGHVNRGDAQIVGQIGDLELQCFAQLLVQRAERFVHQHQFGFEHQRAGQRDPLLLTTGQLRGRRPPKSPIWTMSSARLTFVSRSDLPILRTSSGKDEVFGDRHMREQGVVLEHHADAAFVRRDVVDRHTVQADIAVGRGLKPGQHHQAGRLARPDGPSIVRNSPLGMDRLRSLTTRVSPS